MKLKNYENRQMKMTKIIVAVMTSVMLMGCVSENIEKSRGNKTTENVNTSEFHNISITGSFSVHFIQSNITSVKMHGRENDIKEIEIRNNGNTLHIGTKSHKGLQLFSYNKVGNVDIYITSPNLRNIKITGSGDFVTEGNIDTDKMEINISGSGDAKIKGLICNSISVKIAGSGNLDIDKMSAAGAALSIAGSGSINMDNVNIGHVESNIAGSGSIKLKGNVKSHKKKIAGSGSVEIN